MYLFFYDQFYEYEIVPHIGFETFYFHTQLREFFFDRTYMYSSLYILLFVPMSECNLLTRNNQNHFDIMMQQ